MMIRIYLTYLFIFCVLPFTGQSPCIDGLVEDTWPCENVDMWSFMSIEDIGGGVNTNDCWGWTDINSSREFALIGKDNATSFIEITDPENPIYLGDLPTYTENSLWRDLKVYKNHAFIVSEAGYHGMQVFDLNQLLEVYEPTNFVESAYFGDFGNSHNIIINEDSGFAYAVGCTTFGGGLHVVDISDPTNPLTVGGFADDGYTHDAQVVNYSGPDNDYLGKEIAFCANEDQIAIVEVTNKSDMQLIEHLNYPDFVYTHQLWLSHDQKYMFFNDEGDEIEFDQNTRTYIADVSDLDNPQLIGFYEANNPAIDHNLYTEGNVIYASNYRSGLRVLDFGDAENDNLIERGYFDVSPNNDNPQFSGTWSNYPYFPSGSIIVTDMNDGFFVLRPALLTLEESSFSIECGTESYTNELSINSELSGSNFTLSLSGAPMGMTVTSSDDVVVPGATNITFENLEYVLPGNYFFELHIDSEDYGFYVVETNLQVGDNIDSPSLTGPIDGFSSMDLELTLEWSMIDEAYSYEVEIASDEAFENIVYTDEVNVNSISLDEELPAGQYFWRVKALGNCSTSIASENWAFIIGAVSVESIEYPVLQTFPNPVESILTIEAGMNIGELTIVDMTGREVFVDLINDQRASIDMSKFDSGHYILRWGNGKYSKEVVKH